MKIQGGSQESLLGALIPTGSGMATFNLKNSQPMYQQMPAVMMKNAPQAQTL